VLPAGLDDDVALSLVRTLRPRLVVLPVLPPGRTSSLPISLAHGAPAVRQWTANDKAEITLDHPDSACR
jgi:hypothetical protein